MGRRTKAIDISLVTDLKEKMATNTDAIEEPPCVRNEMDRLAIEGNTEKLFEYYKNAKGYEQYAISLGKAAGALAMAKILESIHLSKDSRILDVGAGTGIMGEKLKEVGYTNVDALDAVEEMLLFAQSKGVYKEYIHEAIIPGKKVNIADNTYDALCLLGAFLIGHITKTSLPELMRITKPGGVIMFNVFQHWMKTDPEFHKDSIEAELQSFVDNGSCTKWSKQDITVFSSNGEITPVYLLTLKQ
ncbi:malonyl-[acyl-carrier protein] O-methyltransferase-like isoform X1 [Amphiura filiformis]|uniref:malonyl-[acyl-carrier protein] O-methyltransferase-like isoform X1 n=2 Tax=Amphiura filiformis TaxID=82378 RepID=UPI003B2274E2